jgi:hypothetical protein
MKYLPVFFLILMTFSCSEDRPDTPRVDTPLDVAVVDTPVIILDTVISEDGTPVIVRHDCSILNKRIPPDSALEQLQYDLDEFAFCVDSFDFTYVVPNLLASWMSEERVKGNNGITYGDFMKHLKEFKTTEGYAQLHQQVMTLDSVRSLPFDASKVDAMKPTFGKLGMTEAEWKALSGFAKTYPVPDKSKTVFSWGNMMDAFEQYFSEYQTRTQ